MKLQITHCLLVNPNIETAGLRHIEYCESKFPRELGDTMVIDGHRLTIGVIGDTKEDVMKVRNEMVTKQNEIINAENKITRRENRIAKAKAQQEYYDNMSDNDKRLYAELAALVKLTK